MRTADFDYHLPPELIAQTPLPRGESRLLVLNRASGQIEFRRFGDLSEYLQAGDVLVINDSRVIARRLKAVREGGQPAEVLLLRPRGETDWEALVRPGKRLRPGARLRLLLRAEEMAAACVVETTAEGGRILRFADTASRDRLMQEGTVPLPPYIHATLEDEERYQTIYAEPGGSAAAPTAGLHFTPELLAKVEAQGVSIARVTLHVGVDTFRPVRAETAEEHVMHGEWFTLSEGNAARINAARGRIIGVGTTVVRALESAASGLQCVRPATGETRLFITPGYQFQVVQALLTNFHLPKSTLLMLVSAFAGRERVLDAYRAAIAERFRFYSFGDAMFIL
jgi:S-adenosylmethionine:tRNA ribosyltransferase-isomerase